jgi:hypothetical protein
MSRRRIFGDIENGARNAFQSCIGDQTEPVADPLRITTVDHETGLSQDHHVAGHGRLADAGSRHQLAQAKLIMSAQEPKGSPTRRMAKRRKNKINRKHARLSRRAHMPATTWVKGARN